MKKILLSIIIIFIYSMNKAQNPVVKSINNFGIKVYKQLPLNKNTFISPYSTNSALAMTYAGSANETQKEMGEIMEIEPGDDFFIQFKALQNTLTNSNSLTLKVANSLWIQNDYKIEKQYLDFIKETFNAPYKKVDFKSSKNREKARKAINNWVEKQTEDKIKDLIGPRSINGETKLVLTNALYFKSAWEKTFEVNKTKKEAFFTEKNKTTTIDFMHKSMDLKYYEDSFVQALEIPYKENASSMIIFLPKNIEGLASWEKNINSDLLHDFYIHSKKENVKISFPKFKIEYEIELSQVLKDIGMKNAFSKEADFSKINTDKKLKLDKVIHKTFIELDENGTEAAAATAVVMMRKTSVGHINPILFNANHPFFFMIVDNNSHGILFMGRLVNPK